MPSGSIVKKLLVAILGLTLASSGLAYAGVEGAPNPVGDVIDLATDQGDGENEAENGDENRAEPTDLPDEAVRGQEWADSRKAAAKSFTDAKRAWTDCVSEAAAGSEEEFDPVAACGEKPRPQDHGLGEKPPWAGENGEDGKATGQERAEQAKANRPDDAGTQSEDGDENRPDNAGRPDGTPDGKPDGTPDGKPDDTPGGPPQN